MNCSKYVQNSMLTLAIYFCSQASELLLHAHTSAFLRVGQVCQIAQSNDANLDEGTLANSESDVTNREKKLKRFCTRSCIVMLVNLNTLVHVKNVSIGLVLNKKKFTKGNNNRKERIPKICKESFTALNKIS